MTPEPLIMYGLFVTPIGWGWALFVWGYGLIWFLINDRLKLADYGIFDHRLPSFLARVRRV